MNSPVCISCGRIVGDKVIAFLIQTQRKEIAYAKKHNFGTVYKNQPIYMEMLLETQNYDISDILDGLGLWQICCRQTMLTYFNLFNHNNNVNPESYKIQHS